jgi:DNA polymerase-4
MSGESTRAILHCDMDAFYASIEQRDRPELRGRPVIVGGRGPRGVVSTASYEARKFGIHSAMPSAQARRLAPPDAVFVTPRMGVYSSVSAEIFNIFRKFTPAVEPLSLDEAFLDVGASEALFGSAARMAATIQEEVFARTQLTVSVGVATTKFVAKVASDYKKPRGLTVVAPGTEAEFLAPLPVRSLWGAGKATVTRLEQLGMHRIGDVARWPLEDLVRALGDSAGTHFHRLSHGLDPREVEPERDAKSIGRETTFDVDVESESELEYVLLQMSADVGRRLRAGRARATVVKLKLRYPPFVTMTRQRTLDAPTHDDVAMYKTALELLRETRRANEPVRLIGLSCAGIEDVGSPRQATFAEVIERDPNAERLHRAIDAIRNKFGDGAIGRGARRDAGPDRFSAPPR